MRELDFLKVWEREIWKKRIAYAVASVFLFISLIVLLSSGEKKTEKDRVLEYIVCRLNYTPDDVERAYLNCPYQYKGLGYDTATEVERREIRAKGLMSFFYPTEIEYDLRSRAWVVRGVRLFGNVEEGFTTKRVSVYVVKNRGFLVERIDEQ